MTQKLFLGLLGSFLLPILVVLFIYFKVENGDGTPIEGRFFWILYVIIRCSSLLLFISVLRTYKPFPAIRYTIILILILEAFLTIYPRNFGGASFMRLNWYALFYHPINENGFRDYEDNQDSKDIIAFTGDSFAAGLGIKSIKNRYDRVYERNSTAKYNVLNLAIPGTGPNEQLENLKRYAPNAKIVIHQYFLNDLDESIVRFGKEDLLIANESDIRKVLKNPLLHFSYIVNALYWSFPKLYIDELDTKIEEYYKFIQSKEIWEFHFRELQSIIDYCDEKEIELVIVVFPNLANPEGSITYYNRVTNFFKNHGLKVVDVHELTKTLSTSQKVLNSQDAHASPIVHKLIGEDLVDILNNVQ